MPDLITKNYNLLFNHYFLVNRIDSKLSPCGSSCGREKNNLPEIRILGGLGEVKPADESVKEYVGQVKFFL